jgi:type IV pilus assembly protein PilV
MRKSQRGSSLIEGLAAIVIFAFGMLGLVGLKTQLMQQSTNAQLRAQASFLAEELIGLATSDAANVACYQMTADGPSSCDSAVAQTAVADWRTRTLAALPGASTTPPTVTYANDGALTVTILWQRPTESMQHNYISTTNLYPGY